MSFDFVNRPTTPYNTYGGMNPGFNAPQYQNPVIMNDQQQKLMEQQKKIEAVIKANETPDIVSGGGLFKPVDNDPSSSTITVPIEISDGEKEKRKVGRPRKESSGNAEIIRPVEKMEGTVQEMPTAVTYSNTSMMLSETLSQIDAINAELHQEFEAVKSNRTMKNKYGVLIGLSENMASLIGNRIAVIKEINSSIKNSNELDYKKLKDIKQAQGSVDDDKYIADLYKSFITTQQTNVPMQQIPTVDTSTYGSAGIIRANVNNSGNMVGAVADPSYLNYVANASPEQRLMMYEGNNNVKQCIVYDASTGAKAFQYFDMSNMQPIPNMPVYSDMLLEEFTIDIVNKIAKSTTMKEQMPVIVINDNITSQY